MTFTVLPPLTMSEIEARCQMDPNGGCWLWDTADDYPTVRRGGRLLRVSRIVLAFKLGMEVADLSAKVMACHNCDVTICVNPSHIYAGNAQSNMSDKMRRGRHKGNAGHRITRLSLQEKEAINLLREGLAAWEVADRMHITHDHLKMLVKRAASKGHAAPPLGEKRKPSGVSTARILKAREDLRAVGYADIFDLCDLIAERVGMNAPAVRMRLLRHDRRAGADWHADYPRGFQRRFKRKKNDV